MTENMTIRINQEQEDLLCELELIHPGGPVCGLDGYGLISLNEETIDEFKRRTKYDLRKQQYTITPHVPRTDDDGSE